MSNDITKTQLTIYLDANTLGIVQHIARDNMRSITAEINYMLKQHVEQYLEDIHKN